MSSRALRKLRREQEQKNQPDTLTDENAPDDDSGAEAPARKAFNAFDMLNQVEDEDEADDSDIAAPDGGESSQVLATNTQIEQSEKPKSKSKSKKKKNKKKGKMSEQADSPAQKSQAAVQEPQMDEIDLALKALSTTSKDGADAPLATKVDEANLQLYRLLAVESKHLNALNEMKRLFGNVVLENEDEAGPAAGPPRRRGRVQNLDLGGALAGRHSPVSRGQGLAGLALRRNPFILGKEEWPKATSGGLGMELVEKLEDGTTEFAFVHNTIYQDVQRQFQTCVESMDPQRIIALLQYNPYHISTLLQVSEIAQQQGDHSVSGDLLERALFSFGRSVHSAFTTALGEGKARLDFRRPENREFWLSAWRYVNNLGQRGTWRTAYEWAKLVLSLDPEGDPYRVCLILDQLALRGGQSDHLLQLSRSSFYGDDLWHFRPNIDISSALAEFKLKRAQECRTSLKKCVRDYPWIFSRLLHELNIDHIPKSVWGKTPPTDRDKLECELYVYNAKDLWNTPEAISFLVEVVESAEVPPARTTNATSGYITLEEARHVLVSGVPSLINLIPRLYTTMPTSSSDPLPPSDNVPSYVPSAPPNILFRRTANPTPPEAAGGFGTPPEEGIPDLEDPEDDQEEADDAQPLSRLQGLVRRLVPWMDSAIHGRVAEPIAGQVGQDGRNASRPAPEAETEDTNDIVGATVEPNPESNEHPAEDNATTNPANDTGPTPQAPAAAAAEEPYDDAHNQRWLAGAGMIRLRDFCAQYGTDENAWTNRNDNAEEGRSIVAEYARRVMQLRERRSVNFIMNYSLSQGAGREVKALVEREIERLGK